MGRSGHFALVIKEVVDSRKHFRGLRLKVLTNQAKCRRMNVGETGMSFESEMSKLIKNHAERVVA